MTQTTFTDNVLIDGSQDIEQLRVQGHTTQDDPLQTWEDSAGNVLVQVTDDGRFQLGDDLGMATQDALVEAHRAETSTTKPTRGFHSLGRITGSLSEVVSWIVQELELLGTGGISALHSALRVRLTNQNTGTMDNGAELRAGDFGAINEGGSDGDPVPRMVGLHVAVTNEEDSYLDEAIGLKVVMSNAGEQTTAYAIHAEGGMTYLGDTLEVKIPDSVPGKPATDVIRIYGKDDGKLYAKNWIGVDGEEFDLTGGDGNAPIAGLCNGRLTLSTGVPIPTSDVLAATTLYFTPFRGNQVALYDGSEWVLASFTERSLSLSGLTANLPYDIFLYDNAGTLTLEAVAWTNDTTRATALALQDGVLVKNGATARRYLGTFRMTGTTGQTEDSEARRLVWNYYNRRIRKLKRIDTTNTWTYNSASWRAANNDTNNSVNLVIGVSEEIVTALSTGRVSGTSVAGSVGIGLDSSTTNIADLMHDHAPGASAVTGASHAEWRGYPAMGYHNIYWIEYARVGTVTFGGDNGVADQQAGLLAEVWG